MGHIGVLELLLNHKASVGALTTDHYTPIHLAIYHSEENPASWIKCAERLLQYKASIEKPRTAGLWTLHWAVENNATHVVEWLLSKKANLERTQPASWDRPSSDSYYCNAPYNTPLYIAVHAGYTNIARILLEAGANANTRGLDDHTPLHSATLQGDLDMVEDLPARKAAVDAVTTHLPPANVHACTPLMIAAWQGHVGVMKKLLEAGAAVEASALQPDNII